MSVRVHRYDDGDSVANCTICRDPMGFSDRDEAGENGPVAVGRFTPYRVVITTDHRGRDVHTDPLCLPCVEWLIDAAAALTIDRETP